MEKTAWMIIFSVLLRLISDVSGDDRWCITDGKDCINNYWCCTNICYAETLNYWRCAQEHRYIRGKVAHGAYCREDDDCAYGRCRYGEPGNRNWVDKMWPTYLCGGNGDDGDICPNNDHGYCKSKSCYHGKCQPARIYKCNDDKQCPSGYCFKKTQCEPMGDKLNTVDKLGNCDNSHPCGSGRRCIDKICRLNQGEKCKHRGECFSNTCIDKVCSLDGPKEKQVGIGGRCDSNTRCQDNTKCHNSNSRYNDIEFGCTEIADKCICRYNDNVVGCTWGEQCISGSCFSSKCQPQSIRYPRYLAEGALGCTEDHQCASGYCHIVESDSDEPSTGVCSAESRAKGLVREYGSCHSNEQCYSGVCINGRGACAKDSPIEGLVGSPGECEEDEECYSGYCHNTGECAQDVPDIPHKVANGGDCANNRHCLSDGCVNNKCVIRAGGNCRVNEDCFSAHCSNNICDLDSPVPGMVGDFGNCEKNEQCFSGNCKGVCMPALQMDTTTQKPSSSKAQKVSLDKVLVPTAESSKNKAQMVTLNKAVVPVLIIAIIFEVIRG